MPGWGILYLGGVGGQKKKKTVGGDCENKNRTKTGGGKELPIFSN